MDFVLEMPMDLFTNKTMLLEEDTILLVKRTSRKGRFVSSALRTFGVIDKNAINVVLWFVAHLQHPQYEYPHLEQF